MKNASRRLIYCTEHTGSVHARLSDRKRAPYMPFGRQSERIARTAYLGAVLENNYGYCLGNGKRLYLPSLGRFCSPDLLSPFGGGGLNSYSYAMLDPVNRHDISGRIPQLFSSIKKTLSNLGGFIGDIAGFGETKNVTIISDTLYTFVDLTKKGPRLNIVSHGAIIDGKPYVQLSKDMIAPPEQMLRKISEKIQDYGQYRTARTLICYSGDIPSSAEALGQQVARHTGLPTKSYRGYVSVPGLEYEAAAPTRARNFIRSNADGTFNFRSSHTVAKFSVPLVSNYDPVYFRP